MPGIGEEAQAAVGAVQTAVGIAQSISGKKKVNRLLDQQDADPFTIPPEIAKILNLSEFTAQGDTYARDYETGALDNAFSSVLGTQQKYSTTNANDYAAAFQQTMSGILKVGADFHKANLDALAGVTTALNQTAEYNVAKWQNRQDLRKDRIQAAQTNVLTGTANTSGGINNILGAITAQQAADLMKTKQTPYVPDKLVAVSGSPLPISTAPTLSGGSVLPYQEPTLNQ